MATINFDSLYESLLNELSPVAAEEGSFGSSLEKNIGSASGNAYLIGDLATALGKTREEVVKMIAKPLYDELFDETGVNPSNTEEDYRKDIARALDVIVNKIAEDNKITVSKRADLRKFTARIVSNLADATKDFSERASSGEVTVAVAAAAAQDDSEEHAEEGDHEVAETDQETVQDVLQPVVYKAYNDYYIKHRDDIAAGTISRELEPIYSRIEGMAGEEISGEDIESRLRKSGTEPGRIVRYIKDLIKAGIIEPAAAAKTSDEIAALEAPESERGLERKEFERSPEFMAAYRDAMAAGGRPAGSFGYEE
jgi:hypothetical protein